VAVGVGRLAIRSVMRWTAVAVRSGGPMVSRPIAATRPTSTCKWTCLFVYKADGKAVRLTSSFSLALAGEVRSSIWLVLKTIHLLLILGKGEVHFSWKRNFLLFAGVFFKYLTMPKTKKKDKMKTKVEGSGKSLLVEPSSECKEFVVALIVRFYEHESTMSLESCYV
jgi:hypothetical protein